jgi:WD40-like Beta Propeller Repeat
VILFSSGNPAALARVSSQGGAVTRVIEEASNQARAAIWPSFLPDGRHFLYWIRVPATGSPVLNVGSIEPGFEPRRVVDSLARQTSSRFTANPGTETAPVWFPKGTKIAYRSDQGGLFEKDASGTGAERLLLDENVNGPSQISPDGK